MVFVHVVLSKHLYSDTNFLLSRFLDAEVREAVASLSAKKAIEKVKNANFAPVSY